MSGWILRIGAFDRRLLRALTQRRRPSLTLFMRVVTRFGDPIILVVIAAWLLFLSGPALDVAGEQAALALVLSHCVSQLLKRAISRDRPRLPVGLPSLIEPPDRFSFPSGHASATLSIGLPLVLVLPVLIGIPLLVLALLIGVSRCYLGVHYPGDVFMGWGLALAAVLASGVVLM